MLGPHAATHGYGEEIRKLMAIFYADDALMASRDPELLPESLDVTVGLFERVGLRTNTTKMKVMTCVSGKIHTHHSQASYNNIRVGLVVVEVCITALVDCNVCGKELQAKALDSHLATQHDI